MGVITGMDPHKSSATIEVIDEQGQAPGPVSGHRPGHPAHAASPRTRGLQAASPHLEPVFGQLKTCQKLIAMSRRGLAACESEWLLACTARNLRKLHRYRVRK